jgi:hypothetical protein
MARRRRSVRAPCPTPGLFRYRVEIDAQIALHRKPATYFNDQGELKHRRTYRCVCNGWHITDKE